LILAKKFHPYYDLNNKENENKFIEIQEAYTVLFDDNKLYLNDHSWYEGLYNEVRSEGFSHATGSGNASDIFCRNTIRGEGENMINEMSLDAHVKISSEDGVFENTITIKVYI
jgi:DnaJ-class molecular chaperone